METNRLDLRTPDTGPSPQEAGKLAPDPEIPVEVPSAASTSRPATEDPARQDGATTSETLPDGSSTARTQTSSRPPLSGGSRFGTVLAREVDKSWTVAERLCCCCSAARAAVALKTTVHRVCNICDSAGCNLCFTALTERI